MIPSRHPRRCRPGSRRPSSRQYAQALILLRDLDATAGMHLAVDTAAAGVDRVFTTDYTPYVYTRARVAWIDNNDMGTVLPRAVSGRAARYGGLENALQAWHGADA